MNKIELAKEILALPEPFKVGRHRFVRKTGGIGVNFFELDMLKKAKQLAQAVLDDDWVSVEERLPEYGIYVLAYVDKATKPSVMMRFYCNDFIGPSDAVRKPTYWKPIVPLEGR